MHKVHYILLCIIAKKINPAEYIDGVKIYIIFINAFG